MLKMKKFILFLFVALAIMTATTAQTTMTSAAYPANTVDTVTNTGTKYVVSARVTGYQKVAQVAVTGTKISGTVAGTASLEGSLDGTNWFALSATTYTMTDVASQTFSWNILEPGAVYMRVKWVGTGTMAAKIEAKYIVRKP